MVWPGECPSNALPRLEQKRIYIKSSSRTRIFKKINAASSGEAPVIRSQSHMSSNPVPVIAPRRNDRIRLELAISDVWSQDKLGPGMAPRRSENPINTMMRKLSMASIASNFSRRSSSYTSLSGFGVENPRRLSSRRSNSSIPSKRSSSVQKKRVDFHNTPEDFLPEDFELRLKTENKRRRGLTMAAIGEQPVTPALNNPTTFAITGQRKTSEPFEKVSKQETHTTASSWHSKDDMSSVVFEPPPARPTTITRSADETNSRASSSAEVTAPAAKRLAKSKSLFLRLSARWAVKSEGK